MHQVFLAASKRLDAVPKVCVQKVALAWERGNIVGTLTPEGEVQTPVQSRSGAAAKKAKLGGTATRSVPADVAAAVAEPSLEGPSLEEMLEEILNSEKAAEDGCDEWDCGIAKSDEEALRLVEEQTVMRHLTSQAEVAVGGADEATDSWEEAV